VQPVASQVLTRSLVSPTANESVVGETATADTWQPAGRPVLASAPPPPQLVAAAGRNMSRRMTDLARMSYGAEPPVIVNSTVMFFGLFVATGEVIGTVAV
jgi:hypothetical protein